MRGGWRNLSGNLRGVLLVAAAALALTIETAMLRALAGEASVAVITFARSLAQLVFGAILVAAAGRGLAGARPKRPGLQVVRGLASLASWGLYYFSFRVLDFAVATTLNFTTALIVAALAGTVMRERVGWARWLATLAGFLGVLLVVRPGGGGAPIGIAAGLGSAAFGVVIVFSNRALGLADRVETTMLWVGIVTVLGTLGPALALGGWPSGSALALMILAVAIGTTALWLMLEGFRTGEASALAPVPYLRLVYAVPIGWLSFGEFPDSWTLGGIAVIAASAALLALAESRRKPEAR
jgi:drug/metabolite transporter (DMT)-like permease